MNMRFCLNSIRKIIIRVTSSKRYQNVRSDLTILGPFANVTLTLCVSWAGTDKCYIESVEQKVNVLRAKQKLKQSQSYKNVYMHGSKTHTERILELNAKTLLSELPNGNQYRVTANGRIVKKQPDTGTSPARASGSSNARQSTATRTDSA